MKRKNKSFISVLLAVFMVLGCFPFAANAGSDRIIDETVTQELAGEQLIEETTAEGNLMPEEIPSENAEPSAYTDYDGLTVRLSAAEAAGGSLILTISLDNAAGVASLNIFVNFNAEKLEFVRTIGESEDYSPMTVGGVTCDNSSQLGIGAIWMEHCLANNIDIISFEFKVLKGGEAEFALADIGIWDADNTRMAFAGDNLNVNL